MINLEQHHFRDEALFRFFQTGKLDRVIPSNLATVLARKLDMISAAENLNDLKSPPANRLELLEPKQNNHYSIRVNKQYRLIFKFENGELSDLHLDAHNYDL